MEGGRGARRLAPSSSGCSWAAFEETAKGYELKSGLLGSSRNPFSPTTRQLCREDMAIYGEEPASDSLALVVCQQCGRVVKSQALSKHKELYHSKVLHIPPPKHIHHVHTVGQSSSASITDEPRGLQFPHSGDPHLVRRGSGLASGGGVMGFAATELPRQNSSGGVETGGRAGEGGTTKPSKEYDPNRHCGVWIEEDQRHCMRSLTCKFHPPSQKESVLGRSRPFSELLEEHRRRRKLKKHGMKQTGSGSGHTPSSSHPQTSSAADPPPLTAHPLYPTPLPPHGPTSPPLPLRPPSSSAEGPGGKGDRGGGWVVREDQSEDDEPNNDRGLPSRPEYPTPLAVCSFGSRSTRCGSLVFGRRGDRLRSALATLGGRTKDFTETTLHRKHSYSSLLQQRKQRKHFAHKDMFTHKKPSLRSVISPTVTGTFTTALCPNTTPLPLTSPPPPVLPRLPSHYLPPPPLPPTAVSLAPTPGGESRGNSTVEEPRTPMVNGRDAAIEDGAIEDGGGVEEGRRETERGKRNRDRRTKTRRGRRKHQKIVQSSGDAPSNQHTPEPTHNHVHPLPPESATVVRGDGVGVANLPPTSRAVTVESHGITSDGARVVSPQRGGRGEKGRGSVGVGDFRMVQIKEEPMDEDTVSDRRHVQHSTPHKTPASKPHSLLMNGIITPPPPLSSIHSPVRSYNAANSTRGSPQTFLINPSGGGHPMVTSLSPHMTGFLPLRGSQLQQQQQQPQQQHQSTQQQPPQSFTFGHSLQGLPMQMLNDTLQRRMMQQGAFWLAQQSQSPQVGVTGRGGGEAGVPRQQNLVSGSPILHSLNSTPTFPQSQSHHQTQFLSLQHANATSGRVRAPISPIPSGIPVHEALHRNVPSAGSGSLPPVRHQSPPTLFGHQSSLHTKQQTLSTPPPAQQRVT